MSLRTVILIGFLFIFHLKNISQDYFSYGGGNYSGLNQVIANPATAADNRVKIDVILSGFDSNFNNSWFGIKRESLTISGYLKDLSSLKLPSSWKNATPNVPNNVYKNFTILASEKSLAAVVENRILLPSVLYQINSKHSVAFCWNVRQIGNVDGISQELAYLFEKELDLSVTQNNRIQNRNLTAVQMTWTEFGFTYAKVLKDKHKHFVKAGITPKLMFGIESGYLIVKELDFLFSSKDTLGYFNADFSYAHSANFNYPFGPGNSATEFYHPITKPMPGLDLGIIYEWRPHYQKYRYKPNGNHLSWRNDLNKYKLKFGASLVDIGKIKFNKEGANYDLNVRIKNSDIAKYGTIKNNAMFDSLLRADFSNQEQSDTYSILLPTALNTQVDYSINQSFYLNLSSHLTNFYTSNSYKVHNYSTICFAPRFESYWFDVSIPFTFNTLSANRYKYIVTGLNVRLGTLSLGTNNLAPYFKGDVSDLNFYAILKFSIPYKSIKDQDRDGVPDKKDECPLDSGDVVLKGCPDMDHDQIPDRSDACPHQPGLKAYKGCPDSDGDEISDGKDACPLANGPIFLKGCPDADKDSIADKEDDCPELPGLKHFKGCPDSDKDGIADKVDLCPTMKGPAKYDGCPDSDNDSIHDGADACVDKAGPIENKGCPWTDTDKDGVIDM